DGVCAFAVASKPKNPTTLSNPIRFPMSPPSLFRGPHLHLGKRASNAHRPFGPISPPSHPAQHRLAGEQAKLLPSYQHNIATLLHFFYNRCTAFRVRGASTTRKG